MFHTKRKLHNLNAFHQLPAQDASYDNFYEQNKETVGKKID